MRHVTLFRLALVLLFAAGGLLRASEVPFGTTAGMIWVEVAPDGRAEPLHFLLDSGASVSVLDLGAARRLHTPLGAAENVQGVHALGKACHLPEFSASIAGLPLPHSILALDLAQVSAACGRRIDGLLGADFFRGRVVQIDYAAKRVRFLERAAGSGESLPLATRNGAFCVRLTVGGGASGWARVDTGCNTALQWVVATGEAAKLGRASIGLNAEGSEGPRTEVQLGARRLAGVKVGLHQQPIFAGESGLLGNALLSRFASVTFDPAGGRLLLGSRR